MSEDREEEPKIIIDEDWKSQVQREKEEAAKAKAEKSEPESEPAADTHPVESAAGEESGEAATEQQPEEMPPASFTMLVTNLATQAMGAMGHLPDEDGQPLPKNLQVAKHFIDLIGMLEEKTKGNLDQNEERYVSDALHQLRMLFVQAGK